MVFSSDGGLFVTDSPGGAIWRVEPDGSARRWLTSALLRAPQEAPFPAGANSLDFWGQSLYVCNTFAKTIVRIPIAEDGGPGPAEVVATDLGASGLRFDATGGLWVATTLFTNQLLRVRADGARAIGCDGRSGLDCPANLVFSPVEGEERIAYVTDTAAGPFGNRPTLMRVDLGVRGRARAVLELPTAAPRAAHPSGDRVVAVAEMRAVAGHATSWPASCER